MLPTRSGPASGLLRRLARMIRRPTQTYEVIPVKSATTDLRIEHVSGVVIQIEHDGTVILNSPSSLQLHADGDLQISSDTHIGLSAPRIDLN